jgi:alkylated DNA repair dioxygenase AlkB
MTHHIIIKQALTQEVCQLLTNYAKLKEKIKPKRRRKGDPLADIHREYGDPLMETLLAQLTPMIEAATGLELWPTLSFYYTYKNGNRLSPHQDRSSCQIVAGLCMGMDEAYKSKHGSWPLVLNENGDEKALSLDAGDLLIFNGHETEHWREPFTGEWFVSAIFAYVDKNGPFAFQKFDQRQALGKPHIGMFRWSYGCLKQWLKQRLT